MAAADCYRRRSLSKELLLTRTRMFRRRTRIASLGAGVLIAAGTVTACGSADDTNGGTGAAGTVVAEDSVDVSIADTPAGQTTEWILGVLGAEDDTTAEDWADRLHASFTAEVSAEELAELINTQIRPAGPFTVTDYEGADRQAVATLEPAVGEPLDMTVVVDPDDQILGLMFTPAAPDD